MGCVCVCALMNNLVHIPTTPAAQREGKKGMKRWAGGRRGKWTEEGKIKAGGGGKRGMSDEEREKGEKKKGKKGGVADDRRRLPRYHMTVLLFK